MATRTGVDFDSVGRSGSDPTRRWLGIAVLTLTVVAMLILAAGAGLGVAGSADGRIVQQDSDLPPVTEHQRPR